MKQSRAQADNRRNRWFADPRMQCGLLARAILYWSYSVCAIGAIALVWIVFAKHPRTPEQWIEQLWLNCGPLVVGSILMLPIVLWECVRFSSRFAGPMVRFRRSLNDLANGNSITPIVLRDDDFWCEFARDLSRVSDRLQAQDATSNVVARVQNGEADSSSEAMEETTDFIPPNADAANLEQPQAKSSLDAVAATATEVPLPGASSYV